MAERRGGHRDPGTRQPPSGPGAYSSRTDGQTIAAPDLDRPDITFGQRKEFEDAQRAVPLPVAAQPGGGGGGAPAGIGGGLPSLAELQGGGGLPGFLTGADSARPDEPLTTGLPVGPGAGPEALSTPPFVQDDFEALLEYFARNYGDVDAVETLNEMRGGQQGIPPVGIADLAFNELAEEPIDDLDEEIQPLEAESDFVDFEDELDEAPADVADEDEDLDEDELADVAEEAPAEAAPTEGAPPPEAE